MVRFCQMRPNQTSPAPQICSRRLPATMRMRVDAQFAFLHVMYFSIARHSVFFAIEKQRTPGMTGAMRRDCPLQSRRRLLRRLVPTTGRCSKGASSHLDRPDSFHTYKAPLNLSSDSTSLLLRPKRAKPLASKLLCIQRITELTYCKSIVCSTVDGRVLLLPMAHRHWRRQVEIDRRIYAQKNIFP